MIRLPALSRLKMFWLKAFKKRSVNDDSLEIAQYTYSQQNTRKQKPLTKYFPNSVQAVVS